MTDHCVVYVGSSNLDPRSARLNTEMGVVVENEQLCIALRDNFARDIFDDSGHQPAVYEQVLPVDIRRIA